jgi:hypothetical protein
MVFLSLMPRAGENNLIVMAKDYGMWESESRVKNSP